MVFAGLAAGLAAASARAQNSGDYLAGRHADILGDAEAAAQFYQRALALDPENPFLLRRSFVLMAGEGRFDRAVPLALQLQGLDPDNTTALVVLSIDHFARDKISLSGEFLEMLPERGLPELVSPPLRAWLEVSRSNTEGALAALDGFDSLQGSADIKRLHRAMVFDMAGDVEQAALAYDELLQGRDRIAYRSALIAGNFYERSGQPERALEIYEQGAAQSGDDMLLAEEIERAGAGMPVPSRLISTPQEGMAETLLELATVFRRQRAPDVAQIFAQLALHLHPGFSEVHLLLGEIYEDQQRPEKAIESYQRIPPANPLSWNAGLQIANEQVSLDRIDEALATLDSLAAARPNRHEPLYRKGDILRSESRFEEAASAYSSAIERVGGLERRHWPILYNRGIAYEQSDQWPLAEADFLAALELEPEQPLVMNYLAYSWVEQKQNLEQAQSMLRRAVELRPKDGYIVDSLGWVYYRLGKFEQAVAELERAVELRPQDPTINDHLGDALWQVGRKREARFQWSRALGLDPEEDQVPVIEEKLEKGLHLDPKDI